MATQTIRVTITYNQDQHEALDNALGKGGYSASLKTVDFGVGYIEDDNTREGRADISLILDALMVAGIAFEVSLRGSV